MSIRFDSLIRVWHRCYHLGCRAGLVPGASAPLPQKIRWILRHEGVRGLVSRVFRFREVLSEDPGSQALAPSELKFRLEVERVDAFLNDGDFEMAVNLGEPLLSGHENYVPLLRLLGYAYLKQGRVDEAERYLTHAFSHDHDRVRAHCALAHLAFERADLTQLREHYQLAANHSETPALFYCEWQRMEERLEVGDPAIALKAALDGCALDREYSLKWCEDFIRLTGSAEIADPYLSSYVEAFPDDKRALLLPVHIQIIEGDYAGGLQSLLNLQEAAGGEVLWLKLLLTVLDEGRVEGAFSREEFLQQALERFSAELSSDTTSIERCLEIAEILRNNEQVDDTRPFEKSPTKMQALDFLLAASTVDGRSVEIELRIIDMLTRLGEYDLATERAGKLMQANPTSSGVRTTLARLCCYKHDYSTALEHIQKGLAASPAQPSLLQLLAEHHQREGEHEEALKIYRELYRRYPEGPHFIRLLATCEYEIGYPKLARKRVKPLIRRGFSEKWLEDLRAALDKVESVPDQTLSICRVYNFGSDPESPSKVVEGVPLEAIHHLIPTSILNLPDAGFVLFAYGEPDLCISLVQNAVKQIPQHVAYARVFSSTAITGEVRSEGRTVVTPMAILLRSQFAELVSNIPAGKIEGKLSSVLNGVDVILGSAPVEEGSRGNAPVAAQGMGV